MWCLFMRRRGMVNNRQREPEARPAEPAARPTQILKYHVIIFQRSDHTRTAEPYLWAYTLS